MAESSEGASYDDEDAAGPGLDMTHGFVHHIRKNQINRDDYDKELKEAKRHQRPPRRTPAPTRPRKPDLNMYRPPANGPASQQMEQESEHVTALDEVVLFKLEYEDEDGDISKLLVLKNDDPYEIATEFAQACGIHDDLVDALTYRIEQEMKKRGT